MEELVAKIESMDDVVHHQIEKLILDADVPYSCNNKYLFVDASVIPESVMVQITQIVESFAQSSTTSQDATVREEDALPPSEHEPQKPSTTLSFDIKAKKKTQPKKSFAISSKRQEQYDAQQNDLEAEPLPE